MKIATGTTNKVKTNIAKIVESDNIVNPVSFYKAGLTIVSKEVAKMTPNMVWCWCDNCKGNQVMKRQNGKCFCTECSYIVSHKA